MLNYFEQSLPGLISERARQSADRAVLEFRDEHDAVTGNVSFAELDRMARRIASALQETSQPGSPVLLCLSSGVNFVAGFLGTLYAGMPAVPAQFAGAGAHLDRIRLIGKDCDPGVVLTCEADLPDEKLLAGAPELAGRTWLSVDGLMPGGEDGFRVPSLRPADLAFLQYTSGSTGSPKGVMVTHEALMANLEQIRRAFELTPADRGLFWLPQFHDMGLIGGILSPLYSDFFATLCPPGWFVRRPLRWLRAISAGRVSVSGAPNFAYELCSKRGARELENAAVDLSCWSLAFSGAEPVRGGTLRRFVREFAPYGFQSKAFLPCYGLAEATLLVTGVPRSRDFETVQLDEARYARDEAVPSAQAGAIEAVSCGVSGHEISVQIVDPQSREAVAEGLMGEVWVHGRNVAKGYFGQEEESALTFDAWLKNAPAGVPAGPYLRTGDKGFLRAGELYLAGRIKDMLIFRGHNFYPQDIEESVERAHPALRTGGGAAFSVEVNGEERLTIVHEVSDHTTPIQDVVDAIRRELSARHGLKLYELALIKTRTLPKTTSGKLRRFAAREGLSEGTLQLVGRWREQPTGAAEACL